MPELPEVETVCRAIAPHLVGKTIRAVAATVTKLRRPIQLRMLRRGCVGCEILSVRRRAKYIVIDLSDDHTLLLHLGMTGSYRFSEAAEPRAKHDRVIWTLSDDRELRFNDPRRFGEVTILPTTLDAQWPDALSNIGPEPLGDEFTPAYFFRTTRKRNTPIKTILMDQSAVAGIGNIYASEALFRAGIRPRRRAARLTQAESVHLVDAVKTILTAAIQAGGTTISDFKTPDGSEGWFTRQLAVYARAGEACQGCGAAIKRIVIGGRSTFYCARCQK